MTDSGVVGSKGAMGAAKRIVSELPPHELYIEAFAGSGAVGRLKKPAGLDLYIEREPARAAALRTMLPRGQVVCGDCTRVLVPEAIPEGTVLYADPPYLLSTLPRPRRYYKFGPVKDFEHELLLAWLKRFRCRVLVSGYWSELYAHRLEGWRLVTFTAPSHGGQRLECLWCNFPEPLERHDTRWVGAGFRERERIQRKVKRWVRRLRELPLHERAAVLAAFGDTGSAGAPAPPLEAMQASDFLEVPGARRTADEVPQLVLL